MFVARCVYLLCRASCEPNTVLRNAINKFQHCCNSNRMFQCRKFLNIYNDAAFRHLLNLGIRSSWHFYQMDYDQNHHRYSPNNLKPKFAQLRNITFLSSKTENKAVGLLGSTICGVALIWSYNFYVSYLLLSILLSCGNFASLLGGLCQDLFPTQYK